MQKASQSIVFADKAQATNRIEIRLKRSNDVRG